MKNETYNATNVVQVDEETADFISDAETWAETIRKNQEKIQLSKVEQRLFVHGAMAYLKNEQVDPVLYDNSTAYFQGYDYGQKLSNILTEEARKRFYSMTDNDKVSEYGKTLLKRNVEIKNER